MRIKQYNSIRIKIQGFTEIFSFFNHNYFYLEYAGATLDIRGWHIDLPVKAARTQQGLVQDVHPVGGRQHDHVRRTGVEPVHLHQQLIQRVFRLALPAYIAATTLPPHGVDLVDEQNAGGILARHGEHVPDSGRPNTNKHLQKLRPGHGQKRNIG